MIFRKIAKLPFDRDYFMALLLGSEGGLATTSAIAAGLLIVNSDRNIVIITATISFVVQAFNSSVSQFSSDRTSDEIDQEDLVRGYKGPATTALLQFVSHVTMGGLVLLPIIYVADEIHAMFISIGVTLALLFLLGVYQGFVVGTRAVAEGIEQLALGALVISIGIIAGYILVA